MWAAPDEAEPSELYSRLEALRSERHRLRERELDLVGRLAAELTTELTSRGLQHPGPLAPPPYFSALAQDLDSVLSAAHYDAEKALASLGDLEEEREAAHDAAALMVGAAEDAAGRAEALAEHEACLVVDRARCEAEAVLAESVSTTTRLVAYAEQLVADAMGQAAQAEAEAEAELASRWEGANHAVAAKELMTANLLQIAKHEAESIRAESSHMQRGAQHVIERMRSTAQAECEALEAESRNWPSRIRSAANQLVDDLAGPLSRIGDHLAGVGTTPADADCT